MLDNRKLDTPCRTPRRKNLSRAGKRSFIGCHPLCILILVLVHNFDPNAIFHISAESRQMPMGAEAGRTPSLRDSDLRSNDLRHYSRLEVWSPWAVVTDEDSWILSNMVLAEQTPSVERFSLAKPSHLAPSFVASFSGRE
ncbi:hypothetical protein DENSPDRAFT_677379 [Dentipellis sp. KUC8613]|nr:hypothetical protein DENSPDRAFT_677379 [Dentipellis sp. KUC8613]